MTVYRITRIEDGRHGREDSVTIVTIREIVRRDGSRMPYDRSRITRAIYKAAYAVGGHDGERANELSIQVEDLLGQDAHVFSVEEIQDLVEKVLIEAGHVRTAKAFILYRAERGQERERRAKLEQRKSKRGDDNIPYPEIWRELAWAVEHGVDTIQHLNHRIGNGSFADLVQEADNRYWSDIGMMAADILNRRQQVRLVIIAGPSSSGKTTTTIKLGEHLRLQGMELVALNLDNYFFDLDAHPKDDHDDHDYETPAALDTPLINQHLAALLAGESVQVPRFDFPSGKRSDQTDEFRIEPHQVILIDCLHGLYGPLTSAVENRFKYRIYIETLTQIKDRAGRFIRWADVRMLRRMVRDTRQRGQTPLKTVGHWHYVRRSELKHIVPYIHEADWILNSALAYELPVLKHHLYEALDEIITTFEGSPGKEDAVLRAVRVKNLLDELEVWRDDGVIPGDSLLREFIGGSSYEYHA